MVATQDWWGDEPYPQSLGQMWRALQYPQSRLSTRGKALPIAAAHAIFRDQPQAVIDAVRDMIAEIADLSSGIDSLARSGLEGEGS